MSFIIHKLHRTKASSYKSFIVQKLHRTKASFRTKALFDKSFI